MTEIEAAFRAAVHDGTAAFVPEELATRLVRLLGASLNGMLGAQAMRTKGDVEDLLDLIVGALHAEHLLDDYPDPL